VAARLLAVLAVVLAAVAVALPLVSGLGYLDELMGTPEVAVAVSFSTTGALLVGNDRSRPQWHPPPPARQRSALGDDLGQDGGDEQP